MNQNKAKDGNKYNVYVVGSYTDYANWLPCNIVKTMEEADLVLFTGGEDVHPKFYKENIGQYTDANLQRDIFEWEDAEKARSLGKPIFGTCRGAQLGCVFSGGRLVQHMNHPYVHNMTLYDGTTIQTNSLHHQMQNPFNLHPIQYIVAGWARGLSNVYLNGDNNDMVLPSTHIGQTKDYIKEPELVYYRETKWLGIQGHPEMLAYNSTMNNILRGMVDLLLQDKLDLVLSLGIPTNRYVGRELVLHGDEIQTYEEMVVKRKDIEISVN